MPSVHSTTDEQIALRRFPYPYQAALTICSDIDGTTIVERFLAIQEFLNTTCDTPMGQGIGLEIGNSFFPYTPDDSFAYFSSRLLDREIIETFIHAGYIDCLHSYGDGAQSRKQAVEALNAFERSGCKLDVWVDHARAPSNFGKDTTAGVGDVPGSAIYHADVTLSYGIRFVWKGRGSSIVGHGVDFKPAAFIDIYDPEHPYPTLVNMAKEAAKTVLGCVGNQRFAVHCQNHLMHVANLADGQQIYEFNRCNNFWRGLSYGHDSTGLAYVIRKKALDDLVTSEGCMIIYTHLGVGPQQPDCVPLETRLALRQLAQLYQQGTIYVTTTSRLLNYYLNRIYLRWTGTVTDDQQVCIVIEGVDDPLTGMRLPSLDQLQGMTFYVPNRHTARLFLRDQELTRIDRNPPDQTGRESIMIPRTFLTYPLSTRIE